MRLAFFSSLLAAVAMATPIVQRASVANLTAVIVDISQLTNDTIALNNTLNTFTPNSYLGLFTVEIIILQSTQLINDLKNVAGAVNSSTQFTDEQSLYIAQATLAFVPNVFSLLQNIVRHKPAFASVFGVGDFSLSVQKSLVQQQELAREFSAALQSRFSPGIAGYVPAIQAQINSSFHKAIVAYKNCTGLVCLPPV